VGEEVIAHLRGNVPTQQAVGIVHGDFRIDNTLLAPGTGHLRVAAVIDWELSTIGNPVADVAMMCAYRDTSFDLVVGAPSAWTSDRLPGTEGLAEAYTAAGGVDLVDWESHMALAYFKIAVIAAGIDHRVRAGAASGPGFDSAGQAVEPYLLRARAVLS
jgi:aminoglycoside phosphotransferase (APT) family kinase protein